MATDYKFIILDANQNLRFPPVAFVSLLHKLQESLCLGHWSSLNS